MENSPASRNSKPILKTHQACGGGRRNPLMLRPVKASRPEGNIKAKVLIAFKAAKGEGQRFIERSSIYGFPRSISRFGLNSG